MTKSILKLACLMLISLIALTSVTMAARANELNYFHTDKPTVDGRATLVIELGMTRDNLRYVAQFDHSKNQLIIDMENTVPGELRKTIRLDGAIAQNLTLRETERHHTQIKINLLQDLSADNYRIYTKTAERHHTKPYRLVIELSSVDTAGQKIYGDGVKGRSIVIDPGHGGSDTGAVGPSGKREKDISLAVSLKLRDILNSAGAEVVMTRENDRDVFAPGSEDRQELQARVNVASRVPNLDVFVSIHCNAFSSPASHGTETYYFSGSVSGQQLAYFINEELIKSIGLANRGVKAANFYVLRHTAVPATLVELAFITNYREEQILASRDYQAKMAYAIAKGIERFFTQ